MATRWRWPPESCARLAVEEGRDSSSVARGLAHLGVDLGLRRAAVAQAVGHVVVDAHMRIERVVLEHHGDVAVLRLEPLTTRPPIAISPAVIVSSPAIIRSSVDLPQPDGPSMTQELAVGDMRDRCP